MIDFPNIDPVAFYLGDFPVYWYGINYVVGFLLAFPYLKFLASRGKILLKPGDVTFDKFSSFMIPIVLGVIIGGRVLDFVFYNPQVLMNNPVVLLRVWEGGMSIHGAVTGALVFFFIYTRFNKKIFGKKLPFLFYTDIMAAYLPFFLFTGRITNFINGELYGRPTQVPWAMVFPNGGNILRHPSQIYEAITEGLIIFLVINFLVWRKSALLKAHGFSTAVVVIMYSVFRFSIEWFRDSPFLVYHLTMGQILSLSWLALGFILLCLVHYKKSF